MSLGFLISPLNLSFLYMKEIQINADILSSNKELQIQKSRLKFNLPCS